MSAAGPRIAIVTDDPGWHGRQLLKALAAQGAEGYYLRLQDCAIDLDQPSGLTLGAQGATLPDGVFVRGVPGGTLEQVILRLDILHALRNLGIPVYNDARAVERTVDKAMTSLMLHQAGIPTPPTWVVEDPAAAHARVTQEWAAGHEVVCKPLFGSQGAGLLRLAPGGAMPALDDYRGVAYLQRFIPAEGGIYRDFRVFVIGGRVDSAMARYGRDWINNVAQGARCEHLHVHGDLEQLAVAATRVLDMDYAGVDIMRGHDGRLQVLEINSVPAWYGLQSVTPHRIAERLVADLLERRVAPTLSTARAARARWPVTEAR